MKGASHQSKVAHNQNSLKGRGSGGRNKFRQGWQREETTHQAKAAQEQSWLLWVWREPQAGALGIWEREDLTYLAKMTPK